MKQLFRISKSKYPSGVYVLEQQTASFATVPVRLPYAWFHLKVSLVPPISILGST